MVSAISLKMYFKVIENTCKKRQKKFEVEKKIFCCKYHPNKEIEFFCIKKKEFMCSLCIYEKEVNKDTAQICLEDDIIKHAEVVLDKLELMKDTLNQTIQLVT